MYQLILVASLISGGNIQKPTDYYDSKAECLNKAREIPSVFEYNKYLCKEVKNEWFPLESIVLRCKEEVDIYSEMHAFCKYLE